LPKQKAARKSGSLNRKLVFNAWCVAIWRLDAMIDRSRE
jgi:hypothetical protein